MHTRIPVPQLAGGPQQPAPNSAGTCGAGDRQGERSTRGPFPFTLTSKITSNPLVKGVRPFLSRPPGALFEFSRN